MIISIENKKNTCRLHLKLSPRRNPFATLKEKKCHLFSRDLSKSCIIRRLISIQMEVIYHKRTHVNKTECKFFVKFTFYNPASFYNINNLFICEKRFNHYLISLMPEYLTHFTLPKFAFSKNIETRVYITCHNIKMITLDTIFKQ
jgi:hypothetical protein